MKKIPVLTAEMPTDQGLCIELLQLVVELGVMMEYEAVTLYYNRQNRSPNWIARV